MNDLAQSAIDSALSNDWDKAIRLNLKILKDYPSNTDAMNRLCKAYVEKGNLKKAKTIINKILTIDPYNLIARKFQDKCKKLTFHTEHKEFSSVDVFIEEPGKTKIVNLIHLGPKEVLSSVDYGDSTEMISYGHRISIKTPNGKLIGKLTDDLSNRIKKLLTMGFTYKTYIKSISEKEVSVIIRECSKPKKHTQIYSFPPERLNNLNKILI